MFQRYSLFFQWSSFTKICFQKTYLILAITKMSLELGLLLHYPIIHSRIGETFEVKFPIIRITSKKNSDIAQFCPFMVHCGRRRRKSHSRRKPSKPNVAGS